MAVGLQSLVLSLASLAAAQYGPGGQYGPNSGGNNDFSGSGSSSSSSSNNNNGNFGGSGRFGGGNSFIDNGQAMLIAHGVLASLAFVILFPMGSILIRLGSFRGVWLVHGVFQVFAYLVYTAAFGIGLYIVTQVPVGLLSHHHPIIGIVVFCLLFFQPILGWMHHAQYKRHHRRTVWSHGHLWLGRIVVTLGIINGGLGLRFANETGFYVPSQGQVIAYGVVAGVMWLLWVLAAMVGERRRARAARASEPAVYKEQYA